MTVRILQGDVREVLRALPDESVDCCITSPPYWGLRDYGTGTCAGGDPACDHRAAGGRGAGDRDGKHPGGAIRAASPARGADPRRCSCCGAVKADQQIGMEPTLGEHIAVMVSVLDEVRRVLRKDGTLWLNYGDCYATSPNGRKAADTKAAGGDDRTFRDKPFSTIGGVLKAKDLCMAPNRLAIALQEAGWWVRSEIIWHKPNPMPESTKDRPTSAHEKLWLLTKSARYYYDADAIREAEAVPGWDDGSRVFGGVNKHGANAQHGSRTTGRRAGPRKRGVPPYHAQYASSDQSNLDTVGRGAGRNARNVWTIAPRPFKGAHFATFPPQLVEPCVKAGCPMGGVVLDPFGGAGTVGLVAEQWGRDSLLIELNEGYCEMAADRIRKAGGAVEYEPEWLS